MSQASFFPWMSVNQVADRLDCTPTYIRKLVSDGRFPRPIKVLGMQVFSQADIAAWEDAGGLRGHGRPTTGLAALAIQADTQLEHPAPLQLVTDVVRVVKLLGTHPVHVRIYRAPDRLVVLLSEPVGTELLRRILMNHIERVVGQVAQEFLTDEEAESAYWVDIWPALHLGSPEETGYRLSNPVLEHHLATRKWINPEWPPLSVDDLNKLLRGAPVDWYDWPHYTPELIVKWQRDGQPIEVTHDSMGYAEPLAALQALSQPRATELLGAPIVNAARATLLLRLADLHSSPMTLRPADPLVNTSQRRALTLPREVLHQLPDLQTLTPDDYDQAAARRATIDQGLYLVDEYAEHPDKQLDHALRTAAEIHRETLHAIDLERARRESGWLPDGMARSFAVGQRMDRRYLNTVTWFADGLAGLDPIDRHHANALDPRDPEARNLRFGRDRFGALVCHYQVPSYETGRLEDSMNIWWPTRWLGSQWRAEEMHVVVDGPSGGDRPAWLVRHGEVVGLLPYPREYGQWSFGFTGSGPYDLATDIESFCRATGTPVDHWTLEQLVTDTRLRDKDLDVALDTLPSPRPA